MHAINAMVVNGVHLVAVYAEEPAKRMRLESGGFAPPRGAWTPGDGCLLAGRAGTVPSTTYSGVLIRSTGFVMSDDVCALYLGCVLQGTLPPIKNISLIF